MKFAPHFRRFTAWLACLALVFAALAPSLTHAGLGGTWAELCTLDGIKLVKITDGDPPAGDPAAVHAEHCAFCLVHLTPMVPELPTAAMIHPLEVSQRFPRLFYQAPRRLAIWSSPPSRAPPGLS